MGKQLSIIGCGWLGLPLAKSFINDGYRIKGSTTSPDKLEALTQSGIDSYYIELNETNIIGNYSGFLSGSETLIINIPPGLRKNLTKNHVAEITHLISAIQEHNIKHVLYISSTSVFKDNYDFPKITDINTPNETSNSATQLIQIEDMLRANSSFETTILRFGGLFDEERHPAKYLSGKINVSNPEAPINLIHKLDCIEIIKLIFQNTVWNVTLNASYPKHSIKRFYYSNYCKEYNLPLPIFNSSEKSKGKIIDSANLVQLLNYTFKQAP